MGFDRGRVFSALAGLLVGVLLVSALPASAGDDDPLVLGQKNTAKTVTRLNTRGGLRIDSFKEGKPALILNTVGATPPMLVSSSSMVVNLNSDLLDGQHGSWYRPLGRDCSDGAGRPPGTDYTCEMSITLAKPGTFYLSGTGKAAGEGLLSCEFTLDGTTVDNSSNEVTIGPSSNGICASSVGVDVSAGTRTVQFILDPGPAVGPGGVSAVLIFIPDE